MTRPANWADEGESETVGGNAPITIQSMTDTVGYDRTYAQMKALEEQGGVVGAAGRGVIRALPHVLVAAAVYQDGRRGDIVLLRAFEDAHGVAAIQADGAVRGA